MDIDLRTLDDEINDALIQACIPFNKKVHDAIQKLLDKVNAVHPIEKIFMGNGDFFFQAPAIEYVDDFDKETYEVEFDELVSDATHNEERNFGWQGINTSVKQDFKELCKLLDYLLCSPHWRYLETTTFYPKNS